MPQFGCSRVAAILHGRGHGRCVQLMRAICVPLHDRLAAAQHPGQPMVVVHAPLALQQHLKPPRDPPPRVPLFVHALDAERAVQLVGGGRPGPREGAS